MQSRAFLFVPANNTHRVSKALAMPVDAVILDLEDAVANAEKTAARALAVQALSKARTTRLFVRCNAMDTALLFADVEAVARAGLDGIVMPKVQCAEQLHTMDWLLSQYERDRGLAPDSIELMPIVETARGMSRIDDLARSGVLLKRMKRLSFGAGDFALDMNLQLTRDEAELHTFRCAVVLASRAAGLEMPVDTVWGGVRDLAGFERSAERAKALGFIGKMCIHPSHSDIAMRVFQPGEAAIRHARSVVQAFLDAQSQGLASIELNGEFIDYPVYLMANQLLERAASDRSQVQGPTQ